MPENKAAVDPKLIPPSPALIAEMNQAGKVGGVVTVANSLDELVPEEDKAERTPAKPVIKELHEGLNENLPIDH